MSTQKLSAKTLIDAKLASTTATDAPAITFDTAALDSDRTITFPNLSLTLVGTDATQTMSNKVIKDLILADGTTPTKRVSSTWIINLNLSTINFEFPGQNINQATGSSTLATTNATQKLSNKELNRV